MTPSTESHVFTIQKPIDYLNLCVEFSSQTMKKIRNHQFMEISSKNS